MCVLVLSAAMAQTDVNNYQERQIYYGEHENVCLDGSGTDLVDLVITVDGTTYREVTVKTSVCCSQWGRNHANRLKLPSSWSLFDGSDYLQFNDDSTPYYYED